jgi:hypothetical protein
MYRPVDSYADRACGPADEILVTAGTVTPSSTVEPIATARRQLGRPGIRPPRQPTRRALGRSVISTS